MALSNQADPQVLNLEDDDMDRVISDDDGYDPSIAVGDEDEESDQKSVQTSFEGRSEKLPQKPTSGYISRLTSPLKRNMAT